MINIKFLTIFFILMQLNTLAKSENKVFLLYKVNNAIITNIDIEYEKKYLIALNNQLNELNNQKMNSIAINSLIREKIKIIELTKYYKLGQKNPSLKKVLAQFYKKLGFKNGIEFKNYINKYDLKITDVEKKIEIESTWNQFIYAKFKKRVFIDKEKLKKKIKNKKTDNKSFLLSEIIFKNEKEIFQKKKIANIKRNIKEIGFGNTANLYSIADSNKLAGKIGWVDEKFLSQEIVLKIRKLKIGENTQPINVGANSIILKIEDVRINKTQINLQEELDRLIIFETNKQLDKFSLIHFNRIKLEATINEY